MNTWKEECVLVLKNLGGHAYLKDIYDEFLENHTRPITENYKGSIRDALEKGSQESKNLTVFLCFIWLREKIKVIMV